MKSSAAASERRERRSDAILSYGFLVLSALFALFPLAWMLSTSLKSEAEAFSLPVRWIPQRLTLQAYGEMWTLKPFGLYFWNSIVVSGVTALLSTILGALAGYGFSRFHFTLAGRLVTHAGQLRLRVSAAAERLAGLIAARARLALVAQALPAG